MTKIIMMDEFGRVNHKACSEIRKGNKTERWEDIFRSGYSVSDYSFGDPDEMKYKGRYYSFQNRMAVEEDESEGERRRICYLHCLVRYADAAGLDPEEDNIVVMAESAPIDNLGRDIVKNHAYFEMNEGDYEAVTYHGITRYFNTKTCFTVPEGNVAFALIRDEATAAGLSDVLVLDIGGRTMNAAMWHYDIHTGKWRVIEGYTENAGCILLTNEIKRRMRVENISVSDDDIETAIYGKDLSDSSANMVYKVVDEETNKYITQHIIGSLMEHQTNIKKPVCLVGGTGDMLNSRLSQKLNVKWNLGVMANAVGGYATLKSLAKNVK